MRTAISLSIGLLIIAGAVLAVAAIARNYAPPEAAPAAQPVANVEVRALRPTVVEDALTLTGRADPWEQVVVSAEVSGNVTGQEVEEGDRAGNGQVIFRIDTIWFQAAHAQAEAKAVLARQELERVEGLRRGGISSPQDLDRVRAEHTVAEADLAAARMRLDKSVVHAPMNGVVDRVHVERGEWAEMGKPLVRLVQVDRIKVVAGVPESDIRHFALGDTVQIQFDALPDQVFTGDVLRIATTAEIGRAHV